MPKALATKNMETTLKKRNQKKNNTRGTDFLLQHMEGFEAPSIDLAMEVTSSEAEGVPVKVSGLEM